MATKRAREHAAYQRDSLELEPLEDGKSGRKKTVHHTLSKLEAIHAAIEDTICPITQQPMFRPVLAKGDNRFYEQSAICRWIAESERTKGPVGTLRSPVTNEPMSSELSAPNKQFANVIKALVQSGEFTEDATREYYKKVKREERVHECLALARNERLDKKEARRQAVYELVDYYGMDTEIANKDYAEVRKWSCLGMKLDCCRCMAVYGEYLAEGIAGPQEPLLGMHYLTVAAGEGSDLASFRLGMLLAQEPRYCTSLFEPDVPRAIEYLKRVVKKTLPYQHLSPRCHELAKTALERLLAA